ncbi:hypothetical protein MUK42_07246 [Musa troglodytarum]|uniref:Uncharacterized protein n=1 Tax=Musa troglodytarum TaxID=320322 RepID=A0A9E7L288_9LILI|nr:hypothetical protein MUK42_07246 [Musa troglodytarum]
MGSESSKESKDPKAPSFLLLSTSSSSSSPPWPEPFLSDDKDEAAPMEELSDDASASSLLPKRNPLLSPTAFPSSSTFSCRSPQRYRSTSDSNREDIRSFLFFPRPPPLQSLLLSPGDTVGINRRIGGEGARQKASFSKSPTQLGVSLC